MTPLTEEERLQVETIVALGKTKHANHMVLFPDTLDAIYLAGKAAGRAAGIIECSSLCGRRSQDKSSDFLSKDEAACCATACRALLKESE